MGRTASRWALSVTGFAVLVLLTTDCRLFLGSPKTQVDCDLTLFKGTWQGDVTQIEGFDLPVLTLTLEHGTSAMCTLSGFVELTSGSVTTRSFKVTGEQKKGQIKTSTEVPRASLAIGKNLTAIATLNVTSKEVSTSHGQLVATVMGIEFFDLMGNSLGTTTLDRVP